MGNIICTIAPTILVQISYSSSSVEPFQQQARLLRYVPIEQLIPEFFSKDTIDARKSIIIKKISHHLDKNRHIDTVVDIWKENDHHIHPLTLEPILRKLGSIPFNAEPAHIKYQLFFRQDQEIFEFGLYLNAKFNAVSREKAAKPISWECTAESVVDKSKTIELRFNMQVVQGKDRDSKVLKMSWDPKQFTLTDVFPKWARDVANDNNMNSPDSMNSQIQEGRSLRYVPIEQLILDLFSEDTIDATKGMVACKIHDYLDNDHPIDPLVDIWKANDYPSRQLTLETALQKLGSITFNAEPCSQPIQIVLPPGSRVI